MSVPYLFFIQREGLPTKYKAFGSCDCAYSNFHARSWFEENIKAASNRYNHNFGKKQTHRQRGDRRQSRNNNNTTSTY